MRFGHVAVFFLAIAFPLSYANSANLRVFTWEEYFDPDLIAEFEAQYNTTVELLYYEHDEHRDQVMAETGGNGFDIILVDDVELPAYIAQGWLAQTNPDSLPDLAKHKGIWSDLVPAANGYTVPYGWSTYGMAYRTDLVSNPPQQWADLFEPSRELSGFIQMSPQANELTVIASLALGFSPVNLNQEQLNSIRSHLTDQKEHVASYQTIDAEDSLFLEGIAKVAVTYNSDALFIQDEMDNVGFISPTDGTLMWIDFLAVSKNSPNQKSAHQFLNFFLDPTVVAQDIEYHYTASFSEEATLLLPEELREDKSVYPDYSENLNTMAKPDKATVRTHMHIYNALNLN